MSAFSHLLRDAPYFSPAAFESPSSRLKRAPPNRTYTKPLISPYKSLSADAFDSFVENVSGQIRDALAYDPVEAERKKHRGYEGDDDFWMDMGGLPGQFSLSHLIHDQQEDDSKLPSGSVVRETTSLADDQDTTHTANDDDEEPLLDGSDVDYPYDEVDSEYGPHTEQENIPIEEHLPIHPVETRLYPSLDNLRKDEQSPPLIGFKPASSLLDRVGEDLPDSDYVDSSVDYGNADQTVTYGTLPELNGEADDVLPADLLLGSEDLDPQDELMMRSDAAEAHEDIETIVEAEQVEARLDEELLRALDVHTKALLDDQAEANVIEESIDQSIHDCHPASNVIEIDSSSQGEDDMVSEQEEATPPPLPTNTIQRSVSGQKTLPSALQSRLLSRKVLRQLDASDRQASGYQSSTDGDDTGSGDDDRIPNEDGSDGELDAEFRQMQQRMRKRQSAFEEEDFEDRYFDGSEDADEQVTDSDAETRQVNEEAYDSASSHGTAASQRNKRKWDEEMNDELSDDAIRSQERQQSGTLEERVPIPKFFKKDEFSGDYDLAPADSTSDEEDISEHETEDESHQPAADIEPTAAIETDHVNVSTAGSDAHDTSPHSYTPYADPQDTAPILATAEARNHIPPLTEPANDVKASPRITVEDRDVASVDLPRPPVVMQDAIFADALRQVMDEYAAQVDDAAPFVADASVQISVDHPSSTIDGVSLDALHPSVAYVDVALNRDIAATTAPAIATTPANEDLIDPLLIQPGTIKDTSPTTPEVTIAEPEIPVELLDLIVQSPVVPQAEQPAPSQLSNTTTLPIAPDADLASSDTAADIGPLSDVDIQEASVEARGSVAPTQTDDPTADEVVAPLQPPVADTSDDVPATTRSETTLPSASLFSGVLSRLSNAKPRRSKRKTPSLVYTRPEEATASVLGVRSDTVENPNGSGSDIEDVEERTDEQTSEVDMRTSIDESVALPGVHEDPSEKVKPIEAQASFDSPEVDVVASDQSTPAPFDIAADIEMEVDADRSCEDTVSDFHPSMLISKPDDAALPESDASTSVRDTDVIDDANVPIESPARSLNAILPGVWKPGTPIRFGGNSLEAAVREAAYDPDRSVNLRTALGFIADGEAAQNDKPTQYPEETQEKGSAEMKAEPEDAFTRAADKEDSTEYTARAESVAIRDASFQPPADEVQSDQHEPDVEEPFHDPLSPSTTLDGNEHRVEPSDREMSVMSHISINLRSVSPTCSEQIATSAQFGTADEATDDDDIASQLLSPPSVTLASRTTSRQRDPKLGHLQRKRVTRSMKGKSRESESEASEADYASRASTPAQTKSPRLRSVTPMEDSETESSHTFVAPLSNTPFDEIEVASLLLPKASRPRVHSHQHSLDQPSNARHRRQGSQNQIRDQSSPPRSQNSSPVTTRSQCTYHKFSIPNPANSPAATLRKGRSRQVQPEVQPEEATSGDSLHPPFIFLFPGCAASDRMDQMRIEGIIDLGTASADEKGSALRLSDHSDVEKVRAEGIPDSVIQSLIRVVGIDMFREGDCEILSPLPDSEHRSVSEKKRKRESDAQGQTPAKRGPSGS